MSQAQDLTTSSLGHLPHADRWAFDQSVTAVFADMLRRSIPQYESMRAAVYALGKEFVRPDTHVVDLGCSRGDALAPFVEAFGNQSRYVGVEVSAPMLGTLRQRFREEIASGSVTVLNSDLRAGYPDVNASLTLSILTLQFTPLN